MAKYHNTPNGPRSCKAEKGLCPYGRAGGEHYETQAEAQAAYETKMGEAFGLTPKFSKVNQQRQNHYQRLDKFKAFVTKVTDAATKLKADTIAAFSQENRTRLKGEAQAKISRMQANLSDSAVKAKAAVIDGMVAMAPDHLKELTRNTLENPAAQWEADKATARAVAANISEKIKKARDEGKQIIADGQAVAAYANYSLKKKFFTHLSKAAHSLAGKADVILESKYTRNLEDTTPLKVENHEFNRPRYVIPEKVARVIVVPPAGKGETEVVYGGVPADWSKAYIGSDAKEKVLS